MRILCFAAALVVTAAAAPQKIEFEAASLKPVATAMSPQMRQMVAFMVETADPSDLRLGSPGRLTLRNEPLARLIGRAWSVRASQVSGPKWITEEAFDVDATLPPGTSSEDLHGMLQSLLESRFGIKLHREQSAQKGFTLTVAKDGPQLKPAATAPIQGVGLNGPPPPPPGMAPGVSRSIYNSVSMSSFAAIVSGMVEAPVVDMTGLTGKYEITVDTSRDTAESAGRTVYDVVRDLGLRLEAGKVQVDLLVVDQVKRTPSPN